MRLASLLEQFYAKLGNFAYVYEPDSGEGQTFAFDGNRMIVSFADDNSVNWVTFFGPEQDQILEYYDTNQKLIPIQDNRNSIVGVWDMDNYQMLELAIYNAEGRATLLSQEEAILCEEVGSFSKNIQKTRTASMYDVNADLRVSWTSMLTCESPGDIFEAF